MFHLPSNARESIHGCPFQPASELGDCLLSSYILVINFTLFDERKHFLFTIDVLLITICQHGEYVCLYTPVYRTAPPNKMSATLRLLFALTQVQARVKTKRHVCTISVMIISKMSILVGKYQTVPQYVSAGASHRIVGFRSPVLSSTPPRHLA